MSRRKKRTPIPVEVCPFSQDERTDLERLNAAVRRLARHDPARIARLRALAEAWCTTYEAAPESEDMVQARTRRILGTAGVN